MSPTLSMKTVLTSKATPVFASRERLERKPLHKPKWWVGDYPGSVAHSLRSEKIHDLSIPKREDVRGI